MYIGPDALMPLASAVAAITGVALMFGRRMFGFARLTAQTVSRKVSRIFARR